MSQRARVRYAPSPTGSLHIGNTRTALFNYLFAKKMGGDFILRIEDTDIARNVEGGEASQMTYLKWLGIDWDESVDIGGEYGPYRQLERLDIYKAHAEELIEKGFAYKCYCTSEELEDEREALEQSGADKLHYSRRCLSNPPESRDEYSIRIKVPAGVTYQFDDMVRGSVSFESADVGDWVIIKANGIATYNFACVVDDHLMKITHVFRGEEHLTNTPRQMMVYEAFGWDIPTFAHMTLIVNEHGKKLSKRDEDTVQFIEQYANMGFLPVGLFNYLALLGHAPDTETEVLDFDEVIQSFDQARLSKSPSTFDPVKLAFINSQHLKALSDDEIYEMCLPHLTHAGVLEDKDSEWAKDLVNLFRDRLTYAAEIVDLYDEFFDDELKIDAGAKDFLLEGVCLNKNTLKVLKEQLDALDAWTVDAIKAAIKETGKVAEVKGKQLFMTSRIGVSGNASGPDLPMMIMLLGKEVVLSRIDAVMGEIS